MGILGIIAGLILLLAGSSWFTGAVTVGWILLIGGVALTVLPFIIAAVAYKKVNSRRSTFFDRL